MRARAALSALAFAASIATTPTAFAGGGDGAVSAELLFEQARELMANGHYREACPKLALSQRLDAGVGTLLNLADCYEKNGQLASAWSTFVEAADLARESRQPDREAIARDRAALLKPRLATLTIEPDSSDRGVLAVKRDGVVVGAALFGVPIPVDAGPHTIEATAPGKEPWTMRLVVSPKPIESTVAIPLMHSAPTTSRGRYLGLAVGGLGAIGLVLGAVYGAAAIRDKDASSAHCADGNLCDQAGVDLRSQGLGAGRVSTAAFIAGAALVVGGVTIFALSPTSSRSPTQGSLSVGVGSVSLGGHF